MAKRIVLVTLILVLGFVRVEVMSAEGDLPADIKLPPNITIHPPAADAPAALAAFTGKWYGKWHGERTNAYMADQVFIFEKINPSTVTVVSEGIGRFSA